MFALFLLLACGPSGPSAADADLVETTFYDAPLPVAGSGTVRPPGLTRPDVAAGITYEVYVRSFQDSDGDGVGDLGGVRARLPYLQSLGVDTVWLMPLFPAFGPAGYDVTDFEEVTAEYGTREDLALLVADAHAVGIRVLIDLPLNHVHTSHPWFTSAEGDADGPYRDWFVYRDDRAGRARWFPSAAGGSYYAYFGEEMPDLNWTETPVYDAMVGMMADWLAAGIDGFRLDAVLMLVEAGVVKEGSDESHTLVADLRADLAADFPDVFLLAEASEWVVERSLSWIGTSSAPEADRVLDFPRNDTLLAAVQTGRVGDYTTLVDTEVRAGAGARMAGFLGSHDTDRLPTVVPDAAARRLLMATHLLSPGAPVLYYGEELDLPDATTGTGQDWAMRAPMPWDSSSEAGFSEGTAWFPPDPSYTEGVNVALESTQPESMLTLVRALGCLRSRYQLGEDATWTPITVPQAQILVFERETAVGRLVLVANFSPFPNEGLRVPIRGAFRDLSTEESAGAGFGLATGRLGPYGFRVFGTVAAPACRLVDGAAGG